MRIGVLPDDMLLEIFDFYMNPSYRNKTEIEAWQSLVHVCRRWRSLVLASPRRLNLQLYCTPKTPARDTLNVWPALPLLIVGIMALTPGTDNVIAALGQSNCVYKVILLDLADWQMEKVFAAMQVSFPELTDLRLSSHVKTLSVIPVPDSFLGGSAPRLRYFELSGIPFPRLPKLLLSATHLYYLKLSNIPHSGYFSPEAMASLLSVLSSLNTLILQFQSPQSCPDQETRHPPPSKRSVIPTLDYFFFKGAIEYIEDLVTFIDAPQLNNLYITFFNQIDFDTSRLAQFITRTPKLRNFRQCHARVHFNDTIAAVRLTSRTQDFGVEVSCREPDWQLSSIEQICNSFPPLSMVEDLYVEHQYSQLVWKNDAIESALWMDLLLPFTAVKSLYLSKEFAAGIAVALQELVGGRITVLPSLQNVFVEGLEPSGPFQGNIEQFVSARQLSGHAIAISVWDKYSTLRPW